MIFFAPVELAASAPRGQEAGLLLALQTAEVPPNIGGRVLIVGGGGSKCVKFYIFFCWKSWIVYLLFNWIVYDFSNFLAAVFFLAFKTGYVTLKCFFLEGPETGMTGSKPSTKIARLKWRGQRNFWEARGNGSLWNSKLWRALKGETFEFFG